MESVIKFRIKKTITPKMEKEMEEFLKLLKDKYESEIKDFGDIFYVEHHLTTNWKHHTNVIKALEEKKVGRPYLIYPIK